MNTPKQKAIEARPLKELLQILLDEVERNGVRRGLCQIIRKLAILERITSKEEGVLINFIFSKLTTESKWLFPKAESQPRIEFLKNEIEKLT